MSFKTKNMIIMTAVTLLVIGFGLYFIAWANPQKISEARTRFERYNRQAQQLDGIETDFFYIQSSITEKQEKLAGYDREFVVDDDFAQTYDYMSNILKHIGYLDFNMTFIREEKEGEFGYNVYSVRGEGSFSRVYQFVEYIEKGPRLYRVERLNLQSLEAKDPKTQQFRLIISFQMEVRAYFTEFEDLPGTQNRLRDVRTSKISNPFYPYVRREVPSNTDNLIDVTGAQVKAIMTNQALIEFNGKTHMLKIGDRVYLGHLSKILPGSNQVEFVLNKGGIVERVMLKMNFNTSKDND